MSEKTKPGKASDRQSQAEAQTQGSKARQGEVSGRMRKVVVVSTAVAAAAMLVTWYFVT